jgi:tRNA threonylcarbamoyladenosine biosynthesis protein TsaB
MALLLSLETSTHAFSCALHHEGRLIAFKESVVDQTTASMLASMIDELFKDLTLKKDRLNAVVVASGPGSYTGLRIGVATAKGICYALNIPLIAVNTLLLMTLQFIDQFEHTLDLTDVLLCPMLDARRMEVYCMLADGEGKVREPIHAKIIEEQSFAIALKQQTIYFFGEGSDKCKSLIRHANAKFVAGIKPSASSLGTISFQKYKDNEFENKDVFEPLYLKDFVIRKPNLIS